MSKFANAFSNLGGNNNTEGNSDVVKIDWKKVNKEQVELFGTQDKAKSRVGVISGIVDLGLQPVEDGHKKSDIADEAAYLKEHPTNYFQDYTDPQTKKTERHVFWPQKAQRAIAITVDFPQFQYDWGGEIGKKPLRFLLNGEFIPKGAKAKDVVVGRTYSLKETTKDFEPRWSVAKNSIPYKLAVATEVIKSNEPFTKDRIGELIGKHALFEAQLWMQGDYMQDKISFKGEVPEGMEKPAYDEDILYFVSLDGENEEGHVKQLRRSVKNTILRSTSYEGSKLQEQYGSLIAQFDKNAANEKKEEAKPAPVVIPPSDEDDDNPF